ncbi:MAG: hypothetical protein N2C14_10675 [Planctomycetales bacterium]
MVAAKMLLRLMLENGTLIENPTDEAIKTALYTLVPDANAFAVLERVTPGEDFTSLEDSTVGLDPLSSFYLQTLAVGHGFTLEYQEGPIDSRYQCKGLRLAEVIQAFQAYAQGHRHWKRQFAWIKLET